MNCYSCGKPLTIIGPISFRATCDYCHIALHSCKGCANYFPGKPNDCLVPGTEFVKDREASNFCDEFSPKGQSEKKKSIDDISKKLFGE